MRFRAPEDGHSAADESAPQEVQPSFEEEIREILKISQIPERFVLDECYPDADAPDLKLKVLVKFIEMCREEIIPRHHRAMEAIQAKSDEVCCRQGVQWRGVAALVGERALLQANTRRLQEALLQAHTRNQALTTRVKEVLAQHSSAADKKMASDLVEMRREAGDLQVAATDAAARHNYYLTQVSAQTEVVRKNTRPLYLDNNRAIFLRKHLDSMRRNIEDLVGRVKTLKSHTTDLADIKVTI